MANTGWRGDTNPKPVIPTDGQGNVIGGATAAAVGAVNEAAPASDTADSGLNGRLQRIAQGLTAQAPNATSRILSAAANTNATSAKASAGRIFQASGYNANAAARYLKIYNKASAPTVGTDTPVITKYLPPLAAFVFDWLNGYVLSTGVSYALTTASADADTGALSSGDILAFNLDYN